MGMRTRKGVRGKSERSGESNGTKKGRERGK